MSSSGDARGSTRRLAAASLVLAVAAACGSAIPHPDASDAAWAGGKWPEATLASLSDGRELYVAKCAGCHQLHRPEERSESEWRTIVEEMRTEQDVELTREEAERIFRYLATAGRAARNRN